MNVIHFYTEEQHDSYLHMRAGETKLGEQVEVISSWEALKDSRVPYVLLGIPEDIGVRANYGIQGTSEAWEAAVSSFVNIQANRFTTASQVGILGAIDCDSEMQQAAELAPDSDNNVLQLAELVQQLDRKVSKVVCKIVALGKIPILIGGGHNNSYGILKGTSEAMNTPIHCINFDAHTDLRSLEHRHSGNGFSYAKAEGFLGNYYLFGLHRNYTSEEIFKQINQDTTLQYCLFEDVAVDQSASFLACLQEAEAHCCTSHFGLELDMDAIENMGSSAMTPSGFTMQDARRWLRHFGKLPNCRYIHICEGAPDRGLFSNQVGKAIAYLISDIIAS